MSKLKLTLSMYKKVNLGRQMVAEETEMSFSGGCQQTVAGVAKYKPILPVI